MSLALEIEFLTGVCRAAHEPGNDQPEWPPQPDRVFSALVSAWGARGERSEEREALEWLEKQSAPCIRASEYSARTTVDVFVPPNDFGVPELGPVAPMWYRQYLARGIRPPKKGGYEREWKKALSVLPENRQRKERQFPVACPSDPSVDLVWVTMPGPAVLDALNALANCVGYIGHSASLVRCRFRVGDIRKSPTILASARRRVYPGRLRELENAHRANPTRPVIRPGAPVIGKRPQELDRWSEWLVLEVVEGNVPDIRASAVVCRLLRQTLMSGYRRAGQQNAIPEIVSGHAADGAPTRHPHIAVAPMAFAGWPHADGRVIGFAFIPPRGEALVRIRGLREAFNAVAPYNRDLERRILTLEGLPLNGPLKLAPVLEDQLRRRSLSPQPYLAESRLWATVTPIVLERHLKRDDETEAQELVALACENAGFPRPKIEHVQIGKHSVIEGAPPARPLTGQPPWTRWKIPDSMKSRRLVHALIDFKQNVRGPVILGAGRFTGLGLCRMLEQ